MIRLVKVKQEFYSLCQEHNVDEELLFNEAGRPCVLLIRMNYKNNMHDFVVPLRSNISARTPHNQYFACRQTHQQGLNADMESIISNFFQ